MSQGETYSGAIGEQVCPTCSLRNVSEEVWMEVAAAWVSPFELAEQFMNAADKVAPISETEVDEFARHLPRKGADEDNSSELDGAVGRVVAELRTEDFDLPADHLAQPDHPVIRALSGCVACHLAGVCPFIT